MTIPEWGKPPAVGTRKSGRKPKYDRLLQEIQARYDSGDTENWGVISDFSNLKSAQTTASYLRGKYPGFEFRPALRDGESRKATLWAHFLGYGNE